MATDIPRSELMSPERVRKLLASGTGIPDPEVSAVGRCAAYRLPSDKVLLVLPDGNGRLFESRTKVLRLATKWAAVDTRPSHIMARWLPRGPEFVTDVPRLATELAGQLEGWLDGGGAGLEAVDALVQLRSAATYLERDEFLRLLAYVGEWVRLIVDGEWRMVCTADDRTWEPWVVGSSGYRYSVFASLLTQLQAWDRGGSIKRAIEHDLKIARAYDWMPVVPEV